MKKLVSVSLAAAMVASMTACGSNNTAETTAAALEQKLPQQLIRKQQIQKQQITQALQMENR